MSLASVAMSSASPVDKNRRSRSPSPVSPSNKKPRVTKDDPVALVLDESKTIHHDGYSVQHGDLFIYLSDDDDQDQDEDNLSMLQTYMEADVAAVPGDKWPRSADPAEVKRHCEQNSTLILNYTCSAPDDHYCSRNYGLACRYFTEQEIDLMMRWPEGLRSIPDMSAADKKIMASLLNKIEALADKEDQKPFTGVRKLGDIPVEQRIRWAVYWNRCSRCSQKKTKKKNNKSNQKAVIQKP